jgi:hypothetical protein
MHNIGVGGDFFDLKWTFLNRPISKLKYIKNLPWIFAMVKGKNENPHFTTKMKIFRKYVWYILKY